mmetsp:Transcript_10387/g.24945  ORF Transcript_10387/g.24945 Transcript_10387/m.24945 type:complete len:231 (-) Transcript_10387:279-971(-)
MLFANVLVAALAFAPSAPVSRRSAVAVSSVHMAVAAKDVKALREKTGAGMMDCKAALVDTDGDMEAASELLRQKGLAAAGKRADKATKEGIIETYIHTGGRLGVMVEVNCETDFVAKRPEFSDLAKMVAMQLAASPTVEFVSEADIPDDVKEAERKIEMGSEDLDGKPEEIKQKMVEGRINKIMKTKCLLNQPYIKDPSQTMEDVLKSTIATLGENINIARFARMELGSE